MLVRDGGYDAELEPHHEAVAYTDGAGTHLFLTKGNRRAG
jgi:hypothetical protein